MDGLSWRNGLNREGDEKKYALIWKSMEHCVSVCILNTFRSAREIFCQWNWVVVHERCRHIIQNGMKELHIKDPHEFDKAVCWHAVTTGKDRDPLWRCICSFFFAAAMELDKQKRMEEEQFKKVEESKSLNRPDQSDKSRNELLDELLRELKNSHSEMHQKLDEVKSKLVQGSPGNSVNQTQVSQVSNSTVNHHHIYTPPSSTQHPTQSLDDFLKKILLEIKGTSPKGKDQNSPYDTKGYKVYYNPHGAGQDRASPLHYDRVINYV